MLTSAFAPRALEGAIFDPIINERTTPRVRLIKYPLRYCGAACRTQKLSYVGENNRHAGVHELCYAMHHVRIERVVLDCNLGARCHPGEQCDAASANYGDPRANCPTHNAGAHKKNKTLSAVYCGCLLKI